MSSPYLRVLAPAGDDVDNETVGVTGTVVVDSVTYYIGYLAKYTDNSIFEFTAGTYGAWGETGKTGTHLTVKASGLPGANEVLFDLGASACIMSSSQTIYVYYRGYGSVFRQVAGGVDVTIPGLSNRTAETTECSIPMTNGGNFLGVDIGSVNTAAGDVTYTFTTASGESGASDSTTLSSGNSDAQETFSSPLIIGANEHLVVKSSANTAGISNVRIRLLQQ